MNEAEGNTPQANLRKRKLCVLHQTSAPFATFWVIFVVLVLLVCHKIGANPWCLLRVYTKPHVLLEVWGGGWRQAFKFKCQWLEFFAPGPRQPG